MKKSKAFLLFSSLLFVNVTLFAPSMSSLAANASFVEQSSQTGSYTITDNQSYVSITLSVQQNTDISTTLNKALAVARDHATDSKPYYVTVPKGTYRLYKTVNIYSNTSLFLDGVSLKRCFAKGAMLKSGSKKYNKGGYEAYRNISVVGGTFDGNCSDGPYAYSNKSFSMIRFGHAKNVTLSNITLCNNVGSHHMEIGGVSGLTITNCKFSGYKYSSTPYAKEAIQLDIIHSKTIFGGYAPYDDTPCQNVTISNCTFQNLSRAIGTHNAVIGVYQSGITITNNTFENIQDEAVLASSFKNCSITDNTMTNVGCGIHFRYMTATTRGFYLPNNCASILYLDPSANTVIENNTISTKASSHIDSSNESSGIYVEGCKLTNTSFDGNYEIAGMTIQNNKITALEKGITLVNTCNSSITNNNITLKNSKNKGNAISQEQCTNNHLLSNKITTK